MSTTRIARQVPDSLAGARVLIWGVGIHGGGLAAARWCAAEGARVAILDRHSPADLQESSAHTAAAGWHWHLGQADHPICRRVDLIVASPAIPPAVLYRLPDDAAPVVGADALFFARHRGHRIAVTGTNGKSTTASMLGVLLDRPVGGNSHRPLLDILAEQGTDVPLVCELSSFQLHYLRPQAPRFDAAVLTSLGADHLDWHPDLAHYHGCKADLLAWSARHYVPVDLRERFPAAAHDDYATHDNAHFYAPDGSVIAPRSACALPGEHNARNADLALSAALAEGLDPAMAGIRLHSVRSLTHRFETIADDGRCRFINDSVATTPEATIAGLQAIDGPIALILGGRDKGGLFGDLAACCKQRGVQPIGLPGSPSDLQAAFAACGLPLEHAEDLDQAVHIAIERLGDRGGTVLLSPACASAPPYVDFAHRGEHFRSIASALVPQPTQA